MNWIKLLKKLGYTILILFVLLNVMAAFHAYKFTHFYDSAEAKPLFKAEEAGFFEKAGALMFGVKSFKKPIAKFPSINYKTVRFTTSDELHLEAWHMQHPIVDSREAKGTIIMFHGHGGNKAGILKEAESFFNLNYNVLMVDFRSHGNSSGNICTIGFYEARDVKAAYDYVGSTGETNIILYGISLGAAAEMKAVKDYNLRPTKMILEMPFGSLLEAVKGRCRIMGVPTEPTSTLLTFWGGLERDFWAFDHNPEDYAKSIKCPVLLQWGEKDIRVSKQETESIFSSLASQQKQLITYANSGHQNLSTSEPEKWLSTISQFLLGSAPTHN
jgi:pimeloyl-ACP methyl ester carboxylesterase